MHVRVYCTNQFIIILYIQNGKAAFFAGLFAFMPVFIVHEKITFYATAEPVSVNIFVYNRERNN